MHGDWVECDMQISIKDYKLIFWAWILCVRPCSVYQTINKQYILKINTQIVYKFIFNRFLDTKRMYFINNKVANLKFPYELRNSMMAMLDRHDKFHLRCNFCEFTLYFISGRETAISTNVKLEKFSTVSLSFLFKTAKKMQLKNRRKLFHFALLSLFLAIGCSFLVHGMENSKKDWNVNLCSCKNPCKTIRLLALSIHL